jgi:hypothetical protein
VNTDAAIELAKKLRAEGVRRVEFEGDEIKAIELHEAGPPVIDPQEGDGRNDDLDPERDASTAPFMAAVRQVQTGEFHKGGAAVGGDD